MFNIDNIPLDDKKTWDLICSGKTKGLFQIESPLGKQWCKKVQPRNIEELSAIISLIRPGVLKAVSGDPPKSMAQRYVDRKNGQETIEYLHPDVEQILKPTYGIMLYQENTIMLAQVLAGFDLQTADTLRKAIGHKLPEVMAKVKQQFIEGCEKTGKINKEQAEEIFGLIRESQKYSFNHAHSISYAITSYLTAYCKANYLLEFYIAYFRGGTWKQDPRQEIYELFLDAKSSGIEILLPSLLADNLDFHIVDSNKIRFGLSNIKGMGDASIKKLTKAVDDVQEKIQKKLGDWTWQDYLLYFADNVSSTVNENLISSGALEFLCEPRSKMLFELDAWQKLSDLEKEWIRNNTVCVDLFEIHKEKKTLYECLFACAKTRKSGGGCSNKNRVEVVLGLAKLIQNPPQDLKDKPDWIAYLEENYLGVSITSAVVDGKNGVVAANTTCKEVNDGKTGYLMVAGQVKNVKEITTKKDGQKMAFVDIIDNSGGLEGVVCFNKQWEQYQHLLFINNTILIQLDKGKRGVVVKKIYQI